MSSIRIDKELPSGEHGPFTFIGERDRPNDHPSTSAGPYASHADASAAAAAENRRRPIIVLRGIVNGEECEVEDTSRTTRDSTPGTQWRLEVSKYRTTPLWKHVE